MKVCILKIFLLEIFPKIPFAIALDCATSPCRRSGEVGQCGSGPAQPDTS